MRLVRHRADISALLTDQAWENYCNALHLSEATRCSGDKALLAVTAAQSLDAYFARLEAKMPQSIPCGSMLKATGRAPRLRP
jgi:hypothetical protein